MKAERFLVTGASGLVGSHVLNLLPPEAAGVCFKNQPRNDPHKFFSVDLTSPAQIEQCFAQVQPTHVIHCAAMSNLDWCEKHREQAWQLNTVAPELLATHCREIGARYVFLSSDMVFDGEKGNYSETDATHPISFYGETKVAAEQAVCEAYPDAVIARLALVYGLPLASGRGRSFLNWILDKLQKGEPAPLFTDQHRTPIAVLELAESLVEIARSDFSGLVNLGGPERLNRFQFGEAVCDTFGYSKSLLRQSTLADLPQTAPRPKDLSLNTALLHNILGRALSDCRTNLMRLSK